MAALSYPAQTMLQNSGLTQYTQDALTNSAENSPYFASLMNKFAENGGKIEAGDPNGGTFSGNGTITVNPTWQPTPDQQGEPPGVFATTIAHELGHSVLPGGDLPVASATDIALAVANGQTSEGVAVTAEYIVATQLGSNMHSQGLKPQLDQVAHQMGIDGMIPGMEMGSPIGAMFTNPGSDAVTTAGTIYGMKPTSNAPQLTYQQYYSNAWIISNCTSIDLADVDWSAIGVLQYVPNLDGTYSVIGRIPLKPGSSFWSQGLLEQLSQSIKDIVNSFSTAEVTRSPLVLDLDGDGVETTTLAGGIHFDHDANGFSEKTAWVGSDDGLLVRDINNNGKIDNGSELFGNNTNLLNGQKAANGFAALADLDMNLDGKIDVSDAAYNQLKIWKDANQDGITDSGELITLADAGVQSITTGYTSSTIVDANGNQHLQTSTFTKTDGTTAAIDDVWFKIDAMYSTPKETLAETPEIAALPDLHGYGNVYSLHQSMLRDSSGRLKLLVEQFAVADGYDSEIIRRA